MSDTYRLVFAGEILEGQHAAVVRKRLSEALRLSDAAAAKLFSGQPVVVKRAVDRAAAIKLQQQFKQCGARLRVKAVPAEASAEVADQPSATEAAPQPTETVPSAGAEFDLAAVGADLGSAEGEHAPEPQIDTSHLEVEAPGALLSSASSFAADAVTTPDVSHIEVAPVGERLLPEAYIREVLPALDITVLEFEVSDLGATLSDGARVTVEPLSIDADFDLAEVGEVLSTSAPKPAPSAPDTSHIRLQ